VLDFGLAKCLRSTGPRPRRRRPLEDTSATVIAAAAYMSPEQARGKTVDKRTDIWAFSCVLCEILSARRRFPARPPPTIAAILEHEPDLSGLPPDTPPRIRQLIQRCLEKDARRRIRDIGDARLEIEEALDRRVPATPVRARRASWGVAAAVLLAAGAAAWQLQRSEYFWRNPLDGAKVTRLTDSRAPNSTPFRAMASSSRCGPRRQLGRMVSQIGTGNTTSPTAACTAARLPLIRGLLAGRIVRQSVDSRAGWRAVWSMPGGQSRRWAGRFDPT
jgi:serine/threonine protein kinase